MKLPASGSERYRAEGRVKIDARIIHGAPDGWFKPGAGTTEWFKDHDMGPEMVVVPAGSFMIGDVGGEQLKVEIGAPFAIGRFVVTFDEWDAAVVTRGALHEPSDNGWGRGRRPVINVSWNDAKVYCAWLSMWTGKSYRLLSEAEWEYCCRATEARRWSFGDDMSQLGEYAWYDANSGSRTQAVGQKGSNQWGLYDVHGNVLEWCADNWHEAYEGAPTNYAGAPTDGSVWPGGDRSGRVLRGGSWDLYPGFLQSSDRCWATPDYRSLQIGFRVARTL